MRIMDWEDYPTYSVGQWYDVVMHKDGAWFVMVKNIDDRGYPLFQDAGINFDTRSDAKQWCEIHHMVGA